MAALVMHLAGLAGLMMGMDEAFGKLTPFNLLAMFALVLYTRPQEPIRKFILFLILAFSLGFTAELVGVKTGILFGNYSYGSALGPKVSGVPLLIGLNWFIVVYASGMLAMTLRGHLSRWLPAKAAYTKWFGLSAAFDGAIIATLFDIVMEPAAVKMGFWHWQNNEIPYLNYLTWFGLSLLVLSVTVPEPKQKHPFSINLFLIQLCFFFLASFL